ncbi:hypothetical protein [Fluviicola sp.]|uniref:hypothetical protein n=1 Tax=Fluviicola sp. TaxID=1917219 RepID=UPI0031D7E3BB
MKTIAFLFVATLFAFHSKAQEWQTYYEEAGVVIQYQLTEINDPQQGIHHARIVFRYENQTNREVQLSFNRLVTYSDSETAKPQEKEFKVVIPANSSVGYNTSTTSDKTFYLFAQDKKNTIKRSLVSFDLRNVTIN